MTAKEMLERARSYTELTSTAYYFNGDELIQFVSQLCKEQREECADYIRLWYDDKEIIRDIIGDILNTPLPNIFEEAK